MRWRNSFGACSQGLDNGGSDRRGRSVTLVIVALTVVSLTGLPGCTPQSGAGPGQAGHSPTVDLSPLAGALTVAGAGDLCGDCGPTAALLRGVPGLDLVLTLGDNAYSDGTIADFTENYDPYWGRFNPIVKPSAGNHDHGTSNAQGYRDYFDMPSGPLYYSFDSGGWHFVAMDTTVMDSTQVSWIAEDLASDGHMCEIAYGHHPRFSSGAKHGSQSSQAAAWKALVGQDVEIVLYGHDHVYERFAPMNGAGGPDDDGSRAFVVGTGGADLYSFDHPLPTSEARLLDHGVIVLQLGQGRYSWHFVDTDEVVRDSGSGTCH